MAATAAGVATTAARVVKAAALGAAAATALAVGAAATSAAGGCLHRTHSMPVPRRCPRRYLY